jgi:hypothetical protein
MNNIKSLFRTYFDRPPLTSCDLERSFSIFKDILTPKRNRLTDFFFFRKIGSY